MKLRCIIVDDEHLACQYLKDYVPLYTSGKQITALASLKELEEKLPRSQFVRIHKSYIVSIKRIRALEGNAIEIGKRYLPVGKSYQKDIAVIFGLDGK